MKHNIFIAQNISKLRPKLEIEKCMVMPNGCAIDTNEHPRWNKDTTGAYGTNNLGLDFRPGGCCSSVFGGQGFSYSYMGGDFAIWVDNSGGSWSKSNAQTLWGMSSWFQDWTGSGIPSPVATKKSAFSIRACKDYTSIDVPDGIKFYNAYTDGDGNVYDAVKIGKQLWITENLKTTKLQNGTNITVASVASDFENNTTEIPMCGYYNNDKTYRDVYGYLYNWFCVENSLVDGDGWRVSTKKDLNDLRTYLINNKWCDDLIVTSQNVGQFVKSCRQVEHPLAEQCEVMPEGCAIATNEHPRWNENATHHGTNNFEFNALPGGDRYLNGAFDYIGVAGIWWSSTEVNTSIALGRYLHYNLSNVIQGIVNKELGFSVRCIKDYTGTQPNGTIITNDYTDGDGNTYDAVVIGEQLWTVENLYTTKYQDGTNIPNVTDNNTWGGLTTGAYCWYNNDYSTYGQHYGALYNWYAVDNGLVNNNGYRVPSDADWTQLTDYLINTEWDNDVITESNVARYLKSCRQVNHPLDK